ncbi:hypothetical protein [Pseudoduganella albidiflava]|uniref:Uncharacterized protein n=1 Tax=Pseudoduganella albidiflava TaxID=321983 RepID=A0ABX5RP80_9BURK|nr:hypothetical protein [Pseudoduganella albidiflava]QBI00407.1 hypothetical protein EYF70_05745 [Pseudoduganella albidiflava]
MAMESLLPDSGRSASPARTGAKVDAIGANSQTVDLLRRTGNVGEFSELKAPMKMRYVTQAAEEGGVGLNNRSGRLDGFK